MSDFSDDETFAMLVSAALTVIGAIRFYGVLGRVTSLAGGHSIRLGLALLPPVCLASLLPILLHLTAHEVKENRAYVILFLLAGVVWLGIASVISAMMGINFRDDAVERRNRAAAIVLGGAMLGITCVYGGANIGEGATIWMTFGPAVLATVAWAGAWFVLQLSTNIADAVAIDRDTSSGFRLAIYLIICGLILGRAVAGDYESADRTLSDLVRSGWPVPPLVLIAIIVQRYSFRHRRIG